MSASLSFTGMGGALVAPVAATGPVDQSALVLVNSASASYQDYPTYVKPYLDQFGVPYEELDVALHPVPADLSGYALIIIGQRSIDPTGSRLDSTAQDSITSAVHGGVGLVNLDNDLFVGTTPRYSLINTIFGFGSGGATTGSDVTISAVPQYITQLHTSGETIATRTMTLAGITVPAGVKVLATSGGAPFLTAATYGAGNAVQFASYDWMSYDVLGPLRGLDDLVWRSVVWAARKPFVMRGMPPFVTFRMDDVSNPMTWIPAANEAGFIPWAGVFTNDIDPTEAAGLSRLAHAGKATVGLHAFGTNDFFYFDHNNGVNFSDEQMAANYTAGSAWFTANNIPISTYLVPHYYEIGSNAFTGLLSWGVSCVGTQMDPGQLEATAPWMRAGPFRTTQSGQAYDRNANPYYSDFMTVPGHPEYNGQFFNLMTEIRDITGYEWQPSTDVANSIATGTAWLTRPIDGMEMATLFTHEYILPNNGVTSAEWSATMNGIAANLAPYHPIYISMDQACAYARALSTSKLSEASYDPGSNSVTATFMGSAAVATKFYVFTDTSGGAISQALVDSQSFSAGTAVTYTLPGTLDRIAISPSPGSVPAGGTLAFSATGFDAANNPIPNLTYAWSVAAGGGTIDGSGRFTAGSATGDYPNTVVATSGGVNAKASVSVTVPVFDHFTFAPIGGPKFANSPFTISISARDAGGNLVPGYAGTAALSASTGTVSPTTMTFTGGVASGPISLPATGTGLTLSVSDSGKVGTSNSFDVVASLACPCSIWPDGTVPADPAASDGKAINLGVKFRATIDGYVTGVRFYKGAANTGTHTGYLWTAAGTQLAQVTFTGESASGWQTAYFPTPVAVSADTTYVVSYYSPSGYFADTNAGLSSGVSNPPLRALSDGEDGPNALFGYGAAGFPTSNWQGSNYWTDVVFDTSVGPDTTPPTVISTTPTAGASGVSVSAPISATFSEALAASSVSGSTFVLRDAANNPVTASVGYNVAGRIATLIPAANLAYSASYTATALGGASGVTDLAGNPLAADKIWSFTTAAAPPPPPSQGPGGPILIVTMAGDPYGRYYTEILRAEGLDEFLAADLSTLDASTLAGYRDVILAPMSLSTTQVTMFGDYVNAGGNLIAMRPDAQLASLLGLTPASGTRANEYLLINTSKAPGAGLVAQTIQFHGSADNYTLAGATAVATLYSDGSTATANPAVTMRSVGSAGGHAGAFTFDLARSVVGIRQGNPAQAGQYLDGATDLSRADNMFQQGWLDMTKVAIPQADEQQRLLVNMLNAMNAGGAPQPRFWYFPHGYRAVVIMSGDDHGNGGTAGRFDIDLADSAAGCSVSDWQCVRSTSYVEGNNMTDAQAATYVAQGFEVGVHISTNCADWTPAQLAADYTSQLATWHTWYPSLPNPVSNRTHCIAWSDYATQPAVELANGIRIDLNYYYWPSSWVQDRPGLFTGSGLPMRFADSNGSLIDVYQATTQMTDESGQSYPYNIDTLLNNALGPNQYFGAFAANMHTDSADSAGSAAIIASAQARGVPVVSAAQMLAWLDGRNASSFGAQSWNDGGSGGKVLTFTVAVGSGANGLQAMLPTTSGVGALTGIKLGGNPISYTTQTIDGAGYAFFNASAGSYEATYAVDSTPPVITSVNVAPSDDGTAILSWTTDEPSDSQVSYGTSADSLSLSGGSATLVTSHSVALSDLAPMTTYYFRLSSTDAASNTAASPAEPALPSSFTTPSATVHDTTAADFTAGSGTNAYVSQTGDGEVILRPAIGAEFDGTTLPGGWTASPWVGAGSVSVAGGKATLDEALLAADSFFTPGHSLEFVADFSSQNQHAGFANDFNSGQWAIFSTMTGDQLYARSLVGGTQTNTPLGAGYLNGYHRYRIDWSASGATFYIDGTQVASHAVAFTDSLRPAASDSNASGSLSIDWMRMSPYAPSAIFTSRVLDAGQTVVWGTLNATTQVPTGASPLAFSVRTGNAPTPGAGWTSFTSVADGGDVPGSSQYLQYQVSLGTSVGEVTPGLASVAIGYVPSPPDTTPPTIVSRAPDSGVGDVAVGTNVVVTFSEPIDATTVTSSRFRLSAQGTGSDVPATISVAGAQATLDPTADLAPSTVYTVTVAGTVADPAGNPLGADSSWSFTTSAPVLSLTDTTAADFGAGTTGTDTYVSQTADGEVTLAPIVGAEFSGSSLLSGWTTKGTPWAAGGSAPVAGGLLSIDGTMAATTATFGPGRSLEFVATFQSQSYQHVGFVTNLNFDGPWAIVSTGSTGDGVYARTSNTSDVPLGAGLLGSAHRYRIDWTASGFDYYVDGVFKATLAFPTAGPMLVGASDAVLGTPLTVDWLHLTPYAGSGTFTSRVLDSGGTATWRNLDYVSTSPAGSSVSLDVRTGNTPAPDGTWSAFVPVANGSAIPGVSRYVEYQATLTSGDTSTTPILQSVSIGYSLASDTTAPTITGQTPAPNTTGVSRSTNVTATFSEPIDPATLSATSFSLTRQGAGSPVAATVTYNAATETATLDPSVDLSPGALYTARITTAVADVAGNHLAADSVWSFTVQAGAFTDTTVADFAAGTLAGTYVSQTTDGEVILAPTIGSEFSGGPGLPAGWSSSPWTGDTSTVNSGALTVDGALAATDTYDGAGRSIEFVATFGAASFQHVGFGQTLASTGESWAMFSTLNTADSLYARTDNNGVMADHLIAGTWIGSPHRFRIDWMASSVVFSIDGTVVDTQSVAIGAQMRPVVSDYTAGGQVVSVDWLRMTPYGSPGMFTSRVFDAGESVSWTGLSWTADVPSGTALSMTARAGDCASLGATPFTAVTTGQTTSLTGRCFQYQAALSTTDVSQTLTLRDVTLTSTAAGKLNQTITFTSTNPSPVAVGGTPYSPTATASSGITPAITLDTTSTGCTLTSGVVSFTGIGTCVLDANQAGDADYSAARQAQQSVTVTAAAKINQTITFTSTAPSGATVGGPTYIPAASASSSLSVALTIDTSATSVCSITAGVVSFTDVGTCVIDANEAGDTSYDRAPRAQQPFAVAAAGNAATTTVVASSLNP
jgi:hypothetical protein